MVFFIPFSGTAIVNIGSADSASGVQPSIYFGCLWITSEFLRTPGGHRFRLSHNMRVPSYLLAAFTLVVLLSLVMPIWINGRLVIESAELQTGGSAPLAFTGRHITQTFYLLYGIVLTIFVGVKNSDFQAFRESLRILFVSSIFASLWGFLQWFCYAFEIPYPSSVFNTSATPGAQGYMTAFAELGLRRISSVSTEPSIFAQYMLVAVVFMSFTVLARQVVISEFWDRVSLCLGVSVLLLTTSLTAYLGLATLIVFSVIGLWYSRILAGRHVTLLAGFTLGVYLLYVTSPVVQEFVATQLLSKPETYSGLERLGSVLLARDYFLRYPVLGVGWGSVTSHDLIFKLLSNTGILGLLSFSVFIAWLLYQLCRTLARRSRSVSDFRVYAVLCSLVATIILLILNILTGFAFVYGYFWFVLGVALAAPSWPARPQPIAAMQPDTGSNL